MVSLCKGYGEGSDPRCETWYVPQWDKAPWDGNLWKLMLPNKVSSLLVIQALTCSEAWLK